ncbi:MAG: class I SAM-dependent methyltransferase [Bdellovibrionales bacterium]
MACVCECAYSPRSMCGSRVSIFVATAFLTNFMVEASAAGVDTEVACARLLDSDVNVRLFANGRTLSITAGSDPDMGLVVYTLDYVLKNLGLAKDELADTFAGKDVLLVGEGFGKLLPALLNVGARVTSVDPLYAIDFSQVKRERLSRSEQVMLGSIAKYMNEFGPHLKAGLAQKLPFPDASFDIYLTHMVWNNFNNSDRSYKQVEILAAIDESLRVVRPGGEIVSAMALHFSSNTDFITERLSAAREAGRLTEFSISARRPSVPKVIPENGSSVFKMDTGIHAMFRVNIDR